ncbi:MAG: hypothetical protein QM516_03370 [Limnohabitans sp.]|nr:hypothetical protein [Limnohabitans sp.]
MSNGLSPMRVRSHITLFATIVALTAALASGGVARFVHMMTAHGGTACSAHHAHTAVTRCTLGHHGSSEVHARQSTTTTQRPQTQQPAVPQDNCAVCAELAINLPTPELASPFDLTVEVLAIVHEREASRQPTLVVLRAVTARPPPILL